MDLKQMNTEIVTLAEDVPRDVLLEYGDRIARAKEIVKEADAEWNRRMVAYVQQHGPFECGGFLYTVKAPAVTKCKDVKGAVEAIFDHTGGDFDRFIEHLSAGAIKHGQSKRTLPPEVYERLFETTREPELDVAEATPARLRKVNLAYLG